MFKNKDLISGIDVFKNKKIPIVSIKKPIVKKLISIKYIPRKNISEPKSLSVLIKKLGVVLNKENIPIIISKLPATIKPFSKNNKAPIKNKKDPTVIIVNDVSFETCNIEGIFQN